jgi:PAS domain S-box-containing protein
MTESAVESSSDLAVGVNEKEPIHVLHVDDDVGFLKVARQCLETEGAFEVDTAVSVEEAMEKMKKRAFDVIICDYQMPEKDGLQFLKELRDSGNGMPFIILTGKSREDIAIAALNLGADQYVNKLGGTETVYGELAHNIRKSVKAKRAEERVRESEEKYHRLFEESCDGLVLIDKEDGSILDCNIEFTQQTGRNKEKLQKMKIWDIRPPHLRETARKEFFEVRGGEQGGSMKLDFQKPSGEIVKIDFLSRATKTGNREVLQSRCRDITERMETEELKASEERLRILFEFAPDAYYLNDLKGNFVDGNRAAEKITGYKRDELIGKSFLKLKLLSRRQIMKAAKLLLKNALGKPTGPDEFILNRKDGTQVSVEIRTFPVKIKGQTLVLGIARDISDRKRAETAQIMNEKLRVVGKLTRHDVRNKLSAITGDVYLAKQKLPKNHEASKYLSEIESAVRQTVRIFDFARAYERLGVEELAYVNVEKNVAKAVSMFSDLHGVRVVNYCGGLMVRADSLLRQLFYNLVENSLKYGEKISRITVYYEEAGKDRLKLVYEDDGVGIPKAEKEKIFGEGYGKGTGYGLYLINKICEVYGWIIQETGKQGKGAQFTITIPKTCEKGKTLYELQK